MRRYVRCVDIGWRETVFVKQSDVPPARISPTTDCPALAARKLRHARGEKRTFGPFSVSVFPSGAVSVTVTSSDPEPSTSKFSGAMFGGISTFR